MCMALHFLLLYCDHAVDYGSLPTFVGGTAAALETNDVAFGRVVRLHRIETTSVSMMFISSPYVRGRCQHVVPFFLNCSASLTLMYLGNKGY